MISWIGYDTHSEKYTKITNCIFILTFVNTGIIVLLANADLSEALPALGQILDGPYNDYSSKWYGDVGSTIVKTMLINMMMPLISFKVQELLHWYKVRKDQNWEQDPIKALYTT
jgi:hypothetical protein